ncbi:MAG: xanthine dehydrogenase accessory protein XdhC [Rhizobiaceae bacterium MnEN-MB40S]|nr:MAG: xanthine dehydrogenase accessory protein XdhC [Rhizobiaceae bacterium MnEN-MB40S]
MARPLSPIELLDAGEPLIRITVANARGSTPREKGTWMLVSALAQAGTIGGGQLELAGIEKARELLASGETSAHLDIPLGPEIGQCCGGNVALSFDRLDAASHHALRAECRREEDALPCVYVFGAGHVGKALAEALSLLPVRTVLVESRKAELDGATDRVEKRLTAVPESVIADAPEGSAYVTMTHEHAQDFIIVEKALQRLDAPYVGMIGSKTKLAQLRSWLKKEGGDGDPTRLICPIGGSQVRDKRPAVIAALVAAELMTVLGGHSQS